MKPKWKLLMESFLLMINIGSTLQAQPKKAQILFDSIRPWGNPAIYIMDIDGRNQRMLFPPTSQNPMWSPDGRRIVFEAYWSGGSDIYVADYTGENIRRLTDAVQEHTVNSSPAWSPDGSKIAFVRTSLRQFPRNPEIYVIDADGKNARNLTNHPANDRYPTWSADGSRIAFTTDRDGNSEIYVMDINGGNLKNLTNHPANDTLPAWSPDGGKIAFSSDRDGNYEIYLMDADGGNVQRLTDHPADDICPTWLPDGNRIVFMTDRDGNFEIYVMDINGENLRNLTNNPGFDGHPSWFDPSSAFSIFSFDMRIITWGWLK
ncbi:PD40 domain-containing protein [Candidatus Poribacteria bacterium]|nr:PD40 domain-containing protein [Candidatus Poribacteria bacterium]